MEHGFLYLVAIIDWATRRVLSWRLSNTLAAGFCVEALSEALARFGKPGIFNTDQGTQFTSAEFTKVLLDHGVEISMDGRGRCHDNHLCRAPVVDRQARVGLPATGRQRHRTEVQSCRVLRSV
jgi:putative transposase